MMLKNSSISIITKYPATATKATYSHGGLHPTEATDVLRRVGQSRQIDRQAASCKIVG